MTNPGEHTSRSGRSGGEGRPLRRERVVETLCEAYARDQIGTVELERRLDLANRVHTESELQALLSDLDLGFLEPLSGGVPVGDAVSATGPGRPASAGSGEPGHDLTHRGGSTIRRVDRTQVPGRQLSVGVWSGHVRKGSWIPAREMTAVAVMGGVELDFREALFGPDPVRLRAASVLGGIHLIVPPNLRVETSGFAIMGGFEDHADLSAGLNPGIATLEVRGFALMGGVSIEVRLPGESARDTKRRLKRERRGGTG